MSNPDTSAPNRQRRTAWIVGSAAVVLVAIIVLVIALTTGRATTGTSAATSTAAGSQSPPAASPTAAAPSTGASAKASAPAAASASAAATPSAPVLAVPLPPEDAKAAKLSIKDFMTAKAKTLAFQAATPAPAIFKELAIGSAYDAMMANAEDFANNGWHQVGIPTIDSMTVTGYKPSATPPQATLNVCVDSSKVNVVTADGTVVRQGTAADRSMNILTVVLSDGKWLVSHESFPANPDC
ncbi:hypothetical protein [Arthrobacter sp. E3]|uniref:hypothetical protein n=1 Tax=Arthrobacter sp. E3 TaxID=517402 RepID=UPI001A94C217|nr:hypothetical protein [Arthrobacter sp. E3]